MSNNITEPYGWTGFIGLPITPLQLFQHNKMVFWWFISWTGAFWWVKILKWLHRSHTTLFVLTYLKTTTPDWRNPPVKKHVYQKRVSIANPKTINTVKRQKEKGFISNCLTNTLWKCNFRTRSILHDESVNHSIRLICLRCKL